MTDPARGEDRAVWLREAAAELRALINSFDSTAVQRETIASLFEGALQRGAFDAPRYARFKTAMLQLRQPRRGGLDAEMDYFLVMEEIKKCLIDLGIKSDKVIYGDHMLDSLAKVFEIEAEVTKHVSVAISKAPVTLVLNTAKRTVIVEDGDPIGLSEDQSRVLAQLISADGGWVTSEQLKQYSGSAERPMNIIKRLPESVSGLIERKRGVGSRLTVSGRIDA